MSARPCLTTDYVVFQGLAAFVILERKRGIEPPNSAWEADVLPLNYSRNATYHTTDKMIFQVVKAKKLRIIIIFACGGS